MRTASLPILARVGFATPLRRVAALGALALVLTLPAAAAAQKCVARPGTAALDQYCETVPTGSGQSSAGTRSPATRDGHLKSTLSTADVQRLERHGDEGQAVLALPSGPSPPSSRTGSTTSSSTSGATAETDAPPDAPSANPIAVAFDALGGVGTLGWGLVFLLWVLAGLAVTAAVTAARRRRA